MRRRRIGTPIAFGKMLKQGLPLRRRRLKVPIDVFHHDHGGVDDDAEVDRAKRQQVGVLTLQHQDDDGEEQCERNVGADDDGAAQIAQKYPLNKEHQQTAEDQIMNVCMRGHADQRAAVVIGNDLDPGRQAAVGIEFLDLGLNPRDDIVGVLGPAHHHDRGRNIVFMIPAPDPEARYKADGNSRDVLHLDGKTVRLTEDDVLDVLDLVTLGDVFGAAAVNQSDAADIDRLLSDRDLAAADVDIGVAERGDQLRDRDVVGFQLAKVGIDVELLGGAAPAVDLHHTGKGEKAPGDDIVLQRTQIGQPEMLGTNDLIAIDLADEA